MPSLEKVLTVDVFVAILKLTKLPHRQVCNALFTALVGSAPKASLNVTVCPPILS